MIIPKLALLFSSDNYFFHRQVDWSAYTRDSCNLFIEKKNVVFHLVQKSDKSSIRKSFQLWVIGGEYRLLTCQGKDNVSDILKIDKCFHVNKHANRLLKTKALWVYIVVLLKCTEN